LTFTQIQKEPKGGVDRKEKPVGGKEETKPKGENLMKEGKNMVGQTDSVEYATLKYLAETKRKAAREARRIEGKPNTERGRGKRTQYKGRTGIVLFGYNFRKSLHDSNQRRGGEGHG